MVLLLNPFNLAKAFVSDGGAGWANALYLAKILAENIKNYEQLKVLVDQGKSYHEYLKIINQGIDNSIGILNALPIQDEQILGKFKNYQTSLKAVQQLYGEVPKSKETALELLHDQTVAESLKMIHALNEYGQKQEENATKIAGQARQASPKGAARMNVEVNAQILHSLNQLIRINGQMLKLQSQNLAMNNKAQKDTMGGMIKIQDDFNKKIVSLEKVNSNFNLPRF